MSGPVVVPSNLSFLGLAKETVYGTAISAPTVWIPVLSPSWKPNQKVLTDEALRGNMAHYQGAANGPRYDTVSYQSYPFIDSLPVHMRAILGSTDTVTGSVDPYTHALSILNTGDGQPPSYTAFLSNGIECWQMAGAVLGKAEVDLKADSLGTVSYEWTGLPAVKMGSIPTNTPSSASPWPGNLTTVTVGGTGVSIYTDVKLSFTRAIEPIFVANGSTAPYRIFVGDLTTEIELMGVYGGLTGSDLSNLLNNTQPAIVVTCNAVGDTTHPATWQSTKTFAMNSEPKISAGKYVEIDSKYGTYANATDATAGGGGTSPVKYTQATAVSTAY